MDKDRSWPLFCRPGIFVAATVFFVVRLRSGPQVFCHLSSWYHKGGISFRFTGDSSGSGRLNSQGSYLARTARLRNRLCLDQLCPFCPGYRRFGQPRCSPHLFRLLLVILSPFLLSLAAAGIHLGQFFRMQLNGEADKFIDQVVQAAFLEEFGLLPLVRVAANLRSPLALSMHKRRILLHQPETSNGRTSNILLPVVILADALDVIEDPICRIETCPDSTKQQNIGTSGTITSVNAFGVRIGNHPFF